MEEKWEYEKEEDRVKLFDWFCQRKESDWEEYRNYVWEEKNKSHFSYDDRKVISDGNFLRSIIKDFTKAQFNKLIWVYSIVDKIEYLKKCGEGTNKDIKVPKKHFTFRVAWHDNKWDGHICKEPKKNIFCSGYHSLLSERIRREKEKLLATEIEYAGKSVNEMLTETGNLPPCFWSVNVFGNEEIPVKHFNPAAKHLKPLDGVLKGNAIITWPFGISFSRTFEDFKLNGKYPANLQSHRVPLFRNKMHSGKSVGFVYAKFSNPLSSEEFKYLIVGCGIIDSVSETKEFSEKEEIEKIRKTRGLENFSFINWTLQYNFVPGSVVRLPYHEYMEEAKRRSLDKDTTETLLNTIKVTIDEPELEHCFKYVAMDIDNDEGIYLLSKIYKSLSLAIADGIVEIEGLNKSIKKIKDMLEICWNERTYFPGFRSLSRAILYKEKTEDCVLDNLVEVIKGNTSNYTEELREILEKDFTDKAYMKYRSAIRELKDNLFSLNLSIEDFLKLSMLDLTQSQFENIKNNYLDNSTKEKKANRKHNLKQICRNPYILYEEYLPSLNAQDKTTGEFVDNFIGLYKIDIALFPDEEYIEKNSLQSQFERHDKRRMRALIIQYLKIQEQSSGDCFEDEEKVQEYIESSPLFYKKMLKFPPHFLLSVDEDYDSHLSEKLVIKLANDSKYFYLKKVNEAEQNVADFVKILLDNEEDNILKYYNLEDYINKSIKKLKSNFKHDFESEAFKDERTFLYKNLFSKRLFVLCGNPGSGKSYEILNIIKYLKENNESYILLAPTGKAALRLKTDQDFQDAKIEVLTIDKFINQWKIEKSFRREYNNIIIDEMSMVDLLKLNEIFGFFEPTNPILHRLILVGDPNQLPPIGFGKPFTDIIQFIKSNKKYQNNIIELDVNCRQILEDNLILEFCKQFSNEGFLSEELIKKVSVGGQISNGFRIEYWQDDEELISVLNKEWKRIANENGYSGCDNEILDDLFEINKGIEGILNPSANMERFQIITPYRVYSDKINEYFQGEVRKDSEIELLELFKNRDKIIRTKNYYDYETEKLILSNGSIGMITIGNKNDTTLVFPELESNTIDIKNIRESDRESFELAYSITIHKSQGSGFDSLIVVLPKKFAMLSKELFYTALTRSKQHISILIEGKSGGDYEKSLFEYARRRSYTSRRKTSLLMDNPYRYYGLEPEENVFVKSRVEYIIYKHLKIFKDKIDHTSKFDFVYEEYPIIEGKRVPIRTDFTILIKGKKYYWEHLGMINKASYKKTWNEIKLPTYRKNNMLDFLITTDELNGIEDSKIAQIIEDIYSGNLSNEDKSKKYSFHHYSLR